MREFLIADNRPTPLNSVINSDTCDLRATIKEIELNATIIEDDNCTFSLDATTAQVMLNMMEQHGLARVSWLAGGWIEYHQLLGTTKVSGDGGDYCVCIPHQIPDCANLLNTGIGEAKTHLSIKRQEDDLRIGQRPTCDKSQVNNLGLE